jgi:hypothetical protein
VLKQNKTNMIQQLQLSLFCGLTAILLHIIRKKKCATVAAVIGILILCINIRYTQPLHHNCDGYNPKDQQFEHFTEEEADVPTPGAQAEYKEQTPMDVIPLPQTDQEVVNLTNETPPEEIGMYSNEEENIGNVSPHPIDNFIGTSLPAGPIPVVFEMEGPYGEFIAEHTGPPLQLRRWRTTTTGPDHRNRVGPPPQPHGRDRMHRIEPIKTNPGYHSQTGRLSRYAWLS